MPDPVNSSDITCPVCGLACDDIRIQVDAGTLRGLDPACPVSEHYFKTAWPDDTRPVVPRINGLDGTLDEAIASALVLLENASAPVVSGMLTDVDGARAALQLADRFGACVDHRDGDALFRNLRVVQDSGWFTTTLSEVRNRADLVVLVGSSVFEQYPRFAERVLQPAGLFVQTRRKVVIIGPQQDVKLPAELDEIEVTNIPLPLESVSEAAAILRLLVRGNAVSSPTTQPLDALSRLAAWLNQAAYSVVVWSSSELDFPHAELAIENWTELILELNKSTRAAGLPLGGGSGGLDAMQVCTWQTGFPLRTSFAAGRPDHHAWLYASDRMIGDKEADLLVWLATLMPDRVPDSHCPRIVIGHPGLRFEKNPEVYIPTGIPGIDHNGHCFRTDSVVTLPLRKLNEPRWPSAKQVIERLLEASC